MSCSLKVDIKCVFNLGLFAIVIMSDFLLMHVQLHQIDPVLLPDDNQSNKIWRCTFEVCLSICSYRFTVWALL